MRLYGIRNCDSVRKALRFFKERGIDVAFIDFKEHPVGCETLDRWLEKIPLQTLFNTRSATYRNLGLKTTAQDDEARRAWLCRENTLIKRPVVETDDGHILVGFDEQRYKERFG